MEEMWLSKSNGGGVADGISNLSEEILHRILGFVDLKQAVQTSILSKKWRYLWTSLPVLDFNIDSFDNDFETFKNFELNFISRRDSSKSIYELRFKGIANPIEGPILMETLNYVLPKGIQKLSIPADYELILPQLFTSQTLKTLELMYLKIGPVAFDLYALMELNLLSCSFGSFPGGHFDPFKGCVNLKWLIIDCCQFSGDFHRFKISAPQLRRLSIVRGRVSSTLCYCAFNTKALIFGLFLQLYQ